MRTLSLALMFVVFAAGTSYAQNGWTRSGAYWVPDRAIGPLPPNVRRIYYPTFQPTVRRVAPSVSTAAPSFLASKVIDGDTFNLSNGSSVRLYAVDAPELSQNYGTESAAMLEQFLANSHVTLDVQGRDKYNRILAIVFVNGKSVNLAMVQHGAAWDASGKYGTRVEPLLQNAQRIARAKRDGLWADPNPVPPWEFRDLQAIMP